MVRVLGVCDSLRYSQTPLSAGIYLLFENRLLQYEGVSEVATLSVSQNRTRRFESCLPRHASFRGNCRSHKAAGLSSILRRGTIL